MVQLWVCTLFMRQYDDFVLIYFYFLYITSVDYRGTFVVVQIVLVVCICLAFAGSTMGISLAFCLLCTSLRPVFRV